MATVKSQILNAEQAISDNISAFNGDRNLLCKNILSHSRNLVEGIAVLLEGSLDAEFHYDKVGPSLAKIGYANKDINFLYKFHNFIQQSISHYSPDGDQPERLMLKYFEYFHRTKKLLFEKYNIEILANIEKFPINQDPELKDYHNAISSIITEKSVGSSAALSSERYYIHSSKPFISNGKIYYEVTFSGVFSDNKQDRLIAFTDIELTDHYASYLDVTSANIKLKSIEIPINVITGWSIAIRPCEFHKLSRVLGLQSKTQSGNVEYKFLMRFLTERSLNLINILDMDETSFKRLRSLSVGDIPRAASYIFQALSLSRQLASQRSRGINTLRYLILKLNNQILDDQIEIAANGVLSNLRIKNKCIPFDDMPLCSSLVDHNPRIFDLMECFSTEDRQHELLARTIKNNSEQMGNLYTPITSLSGFKDLGTLVSKYNGELFRTHKPSREIKETSGHLYIHQYQEDAVQIIDKLKEFSGKKIEAYTQSTAAWLSSSPELGITDPLKKEAILTMFSKSRVALIYGAAGTGKTTLLSLVAKRFNEQTILFAAQTNPAVQNLRTKISANNAEYSTIDKLLYSSPKECDLLVIDECSTVSNDSLIRLLRKTTYKLLVLVGDNYQIESIRFGNWFEVVKHFLPKESVFELKTPWRTSNARLLSLWSAVRNTEDNIDEIISQNNYSSPLSEVLSDTKSPDEIILCLSYGGLYGVNNINYLFQHRNPNESIKWGVSTYKINDPIVFSGSSRLNSFIHNNLKGVIARISKQTNEIIFDVRVDKIITDIDTLPFGFIRVSDHTVRFRVLKSSNSDDDVRLSEHSVPFQIAYAVTIHKAQGLEYQSVKVVVVRTEEESVSLNILYTAITRSTQNLKIYWSPETQRYVISNIAKTNSATDAGLLKKYISEKK